MRIVRLFTALSAVAFAAPAHAYDVGPVAGGGTIAGSVVFHGDVPTLKVIPTKDVDVCGGIRDDALIDVGTNAGVQNAVVYLEAVPQGKAWPPLPKPPELDNVHCRFVPDVQAIPAGSISVVNKDPVLHNTHGYYGKRTAFNSALPNQGQSIPSDLHKAGKVKVDCDAHGWMLGWIYVRDNPYYAMTGADGKFSIADVPAGTYTLVTDQPFIGPTKQQVTVAATQTTTLAIELKAP